MYILGDADNVQRYHLCDPIAHMVFVNRNVVFGENELESEQKNVSTTKDTTIVQIKKKLGEDNSSEAEHEHEEKKIGNKILRKR